MIYGTFSITETAPRHSPYTIMGLNTQWLFRMRVLSTVIAPDSKVHGANTGPIWGRQDPDGPHVGPMNRAIWGDDGA